MPRPRRLALAFVVLGAACIVAGLALVSLPLAIITAGAALVVFGLFVIEVPGP